VFSIPGFSLEIPGRAPQPHNPGEAGINRHLVSHHRTRGRQGGTRTFPVGCFHPPALSGPFRPGAGVRCWDHGGSHPGGDKPLGAGFILAVTGRQSCSGSIGKIGSQGGSSHLFPRHRHPSRRFRGSSRSGHPRRLVHKGGSPFGNRLGPPARLTAGGRKLDGSGLVICVFCFGRKKTVQARNGGPARGGRPASVPFWGVRPTCRQEGCLRRES